MNIRRFCGIGSMLAAVACSQDKEQPNVLLIIADDLGVGDVSAYGYGSIQTPNIDRLANDGIRFNNGYATSATSTPSRYALFTGMYPWRNSDARILPGDAPLLIDPQSPTLPKMMQEAGYQTAAIGKWHLGMGAGDVDWNKQISPSANDIGFDYTCLIAATNDRVPTVYVEDGMVEGLDPADPIEVSYEHNYPGEPDGKKDLDMIRLMWDHGHNEAIVNGIPRIGYMKGGQKARWVDEDMADYFIGKFRKYMEERDKDKPFFMYYGLHQPHVPRAPHQRFAGATDLGPRGDAVVEADWCVGEIIAYLEKEGLLENTLVIFTSDNGPVLQDGYVDQAFENKDKHDAYGGLRGGKYSLFDGGAHVPMITYWKGHIKPDISEELVFQLDCFASLAALAGQQVPDGLDSQDQLDAFIGEGKGRESLVVEAKSRLAYRKGDYMMVPPYKGKVYRKTKEVELGNVKDYALYNLKEDRMQQNDLSSSKPDKLEEMKQEFHQLVGKYYHPDITELRKNF
jgi:arylsulfatase A-like enzyme